MFTITIQLRCPLPRLRKVIRQSAAVAVLKNDESAKLSCEINCKSQTYVNNGCRFYWDGSVIGNKKREDEEERKRGKGKKKSVSPVLWFLLAINSFPMTVTKTKKRTKLRRPYPVEVASVMRAAKGSGSMEELQGEASSSGTREREPGGQREKKRGSRGLSRKRESEIIMQTGIAGTSLGPTQSRMKVTKAEGFARNLGWEGDG
ncbi:hypothetical protein K435DRAFT_799845 [Dendrothele bispora CBS 962.96]|uniref:Uncharacterized protein n=1 Tax=Dendrothele bispora (strain CBS 962.96) TaxID=1314807 RepID=A0A4S8LV97_DENBC|nr:hypothetical protein K435DRAFT_799845 [Dendrothele bispora CBS 962.96]